MNRNNRESESPKGIWEAVGDNHHVIFTEDNFHALVHRVKTGWSAEVTDLQTHRIRKSQLEYSTDGEAKDASMRVVAELRERRKEVAAAQGTLKL